MHRVFLLILTALTIVVNGCRPGGEGKADVVRQTAEAEDTAPAEQEGEPRSAVESAFDRAKQFGADGVTGVGNLYDNVVKSGSEAGEQSAQWVTRMYNQAKEAGETTAGNAKDWLTEDWNNMGLWSYRVVLVEDTTPEAVEEKLNELGRNRWECYSVVPAGNGVSLYLKRPARSVIRNLPARELLRLLPLLGGGE